jgi:hypothetical protein
MAHGRLGLALGSPKGGEIMHPEKTLRRLVHRRGIEQSWAQPTLPRAHQAVLGDSAARTGSDGTWH